MSLDTINDFLPRSRFEGFCVRVGKSGQRRIGGVVSGIESCIIRTTVVVEADAAVIKTVDGVGSDVMFFGDMASSIG